MKNKSNKSERSAAAAILGSRGGKSVVKSHGKEYMRQIARKGAKVRWKNKIK